MVIRLTAFPATLIMSTFCLDLDCEAPYEFDLDGRALYQHRRQIRSLMHDAELPSLDTFCIHSSSELPVNAASDSHGRTNDVSEWFEPKVGLDYFASLTRVLDQNAEKIAGLSDIRRDVACLIRDLQRCLKDNINWRLAVCDA